MWRALTGLLIINALVPGQVILQEHLGAVQDARLGNVVRNAGDVDGDGVIDYIVSAPGASQSINASVRVFSGANGAMLREWTGPYEYGLDVDGCGDVNGDGLDDVIIGHGASGAEIRSVVSGFVIRLVMPPSGAGEFGEYVAGLGDVNMDGVPDVAVSAYDTGSLEVASGATGAIIRSIDVVSQNRAPDVAPCSDVDGDGVPEILVGIENFGSGVARLYSGATGFLLHSWDAPSGSPRIGAALADIGDVDGDTVPDVAVGAPEQVSPFTVVRGAVHVFSGATGATIRVIYAPQVATSRFGHAVAAAGDLNADGVPDIAVGATAPGYVFVFSGADGSELMRVAGQDQSSFGNSLTQLGDLDGDGFGELGIGAYRWTQWLDDQGKVVVMSGRIMAATASLPGGCGGGPFLPLLGATRPVIGQTASLAGLYAPAGATAFVALGAPLAFPITVGFFGCEVWLDPATALILPPFPVPGSGSWTFTVAIPPTPQLAGQTLNAQAYYAPTGGPLGFDLSNALRIRIGY